MMLTSIDRAIVSENHGVSVDDARVLLAAGCLKGQTYEQCLEMAKWHPGMAEFLTKKLPGKVGSDTQKQQFGYIMMYLERFDAFCAMMNESRRKGKI